MSVVKLEDVSKEFGAGGVKALQEIDLEIGEREFVSLIGPSGCGKSTLLRIIGDLIQPTSGEVTVKGKTAHQARLGRDYGIVFQDAVLFDWRTVAKNISLPLEMMGWDRRKRAERVKELVGLVELTGFEGHHPWQLSGGMQQRVSIARAPLVRPGAPADGRALRRPRRDDPRAPQPRAAPDLGSQRQHGRLRHSLDLGGGVPVDAGGRHVGATGRIVGVVDVDLPQPRTAETREEPRFAELIREVRRLLREGGGFDVEEPTPTGEEDFIAAEEGLQ